MTGDPERQQLSRSLRAGQGHSRRAIPGLCPVGRSPAAPKPLASLHQQGSALAQVTIIRQVLCARHCARAPARTLVLRHARCSAAGLDPLLLPSSWGTRGPRGM